MKRALILISALALATACGRSADNSTVPAKRPNVLLVVLDTTRADALSCYGHRQSTTPFIDTVATEGTLYRSAYATSFWTLPSHASLLTGLFPTEAGATSETNFLPGEVTTLAERLATAGYQTGAVVRNAWISSERGFAQGFGDFVEAWRGTEDLPSAEGEEAAVDSAIDWIEARATGGLQPFFLFVNLNIAHMPYTPPEAVWSRFAPAVSPPERVELLRSITGGWGHLAGALELDGTDLEILRSLYTAEVAVADSLVGRLIGSLEAVGLLDDTLVIITSDHGENLGEHGMIDHFNSMYDTTVRVPLIMRYPDRFVPGTVVDDLVSLVDIPSTILDLCAGSGIQSDDSLRGRSLSDPRRTPRMEVYAENGRPVNGVQVLQQWFPDFDSDEIDHAMRMVRAGSDKLIWNVGSSAELYDLEADPEEFVDRYATEVELRNLLLTHLREWATSLRGPVATRPFSSRDTESLEQLRALGYVN